MLALLFSFVIFAPPIAPAPATRQHTELADPFAPQPAPRVPPGEIHSSHPELLSPFSAKYRNVTGPALRSVQSPFDA